MPTMDLIPVPDLPRNRLLEAREAKDLSRTRAAAAIGVDTSSLRRWEKERDGKVPDIRKFQLATLYGVAPAWLLGWTDTDEGPPLARIMAAVA